MTFCYNGTTPPLFYLFFKFPVHFPTRNHLHFPSFSHIHEEFKILKCIPLSRTACLFLHFHFHISLFIFTSSVLISTTRIYLTILRQKRDDMPDRKAILPQWREDGRYIFFSISFFFSFLFFETCPLFQSELYDSSMEFID